jgi:hypothetical protein
MLLNVTIAEAEREYGPVPMAGVRERFPGALITRRTAMASALAGMFCYPRDGDAAAHFWDSKPATQWTPAEIAELSTNSPWAKQVTAQYSAALEGMAPPPESEPMQGRGEAKVGECGLVPCGSIMPGKVVVIWESAQPIREALHPLIPAQFNGRYVISLRGLVQDQTLERLEQGAELSAKGKSPIQTGVVGQRNGTYLFGFSKELMPLDAGDKDVQFTIRTGPNLSATLVRAVFNPKDMIYRGTLAL